MITIYANDNTIKLGQVVDNEAVRIAFNISDMYQLIGEGGSFYILNQRPTDSGAYAVPSGQITSDSTYCYWTLKAYDVAISGIGECQLQYRIGDVVKMSKRFRTSVLASLIDNGTIPTPTQTWLDELADIKDEAVEASEDAEESAEDSEAYAIGKRGGVDVEEDDPAYHNNAKYYAEQSSYVGAVRYDQAQSLTDQQKEQARNNIGASSGGGSITGAVRYDKAQSLSASEKTQARSNIGSASDSALSDLSDTVDGHTESINTIENDIINAVARIDGHDESINGLESAISGLDSAITDINYKIPSQATEENQLADKNFVNSSINSVTAYYITKNAQGSQFSTKADLDSTTTFYSGGEVRVPTRNDYCIVQADETHDNSTTRYIYQNNHWEFQYVVNETALTSDQIAALNSGITSSGVTKLNGIEAGAQVNTVTGAKLGGANGTQATITDGNIIVPIASSSAFGVFKPLTVYGTDVLGTGALTCTTRTQANYSSFPNGGFIGKGTLENVKTDIVKRAITDTTQTAYTDTEKSNACGVIGAERHKNYELIKTMTVSADTTEIVIEQDNDGNNIALEEVFVSFGWKTAYSSKYVLLRCDFANNIVNALSGNTTTNTRDFGTINTVVNGYSYIALKCEKGLYRAYCSLANTNTAILDTYVSYSGVNHYIVDDSNYINKITLQHQVGFTTGMSIRVYGVKA